MKYAKFISDSEYTTSKLSLPNKKYPYIILDIECSKHPVMNPWQEGAFLSSIGIQMPNRETNIWFFNPLIGDDSTHLKEIQDIIDNSDLIVGHFFKFDMSWLLHCGLRIPYSIWCTCLTDYLLSGQWKTMGRSLNEVSQRLGYGTKVEEMAEYWNNGADTDEIPVDLHRTYLTQDLSLTHDIYLDQFKRVKKSKLEKITSLSCAMSRVLSQVELTGAPFSMEEAEKYLVQAAQQTANHKETLCTIAGLDFNPKSDLQLRSVLYGGKLKIDSIEHYTQTLKSGEVKEKSRKCKIELDIKGMGFIPPEYAKTKAGNMSVSKDVVKTLKAKSQKQKEFLEALSEFKKVSMMVQTLKGGKDEDKGWMNSIESDGRMHGSFLQISTWTGRLSSRKPNMQNLPRGGTSPLKKIFVPQKDFVIIDADLSQIEWRVAAELSRDEVMLDELKRGVDIHSLNAVQIFKANPEDEFSADEKLKSTFATLRQASKTVSFRLLYGGGHWGFYFDFRMPDYSIERWEEIVQAFFIKYKGLHAWHLLTQKEMVEKKYVRTPSGRIIPSPEVSWNNAKSVKEWERKLCNYSVQSFSADVFNVACVTILQKLEELRTLQCSLVMLVHDSLVFECKKDHAKDLILLILDIFKNLTNLVSTYFDTDLVVHLDGECKVGLDYGSTRKVTIETIDQVINSL